MIGWWFISRIEALVIDPNLPFEVKSKMKGDYSLPPSRAAWILSATELLNRFQKAGNGMVVYRALCGEGSWGASGGDAERADNQRR